MPPALNNKLRHAQARLCSPHQRTAGHEKRFSSASRHLSGRCFFGFWDRDHIHRNHEIDTQQAAEANTLREAAEPREAIEEQLRAIMNDALRTHPYLATPEGLEDTRKMIIIRDRLFAEGMRPQDALRDAIGQVVGKTVK